jgi:hypothetical protein
MRLIWFAFVLFYNGSSVILTQSSLHTSYTKLEKPHTQTSVLPMREANKLLPLHDPLTPRFSSMAQKFDYDKSARNGLYNTFGFRCGPEKLRAAYSPRPSWLGRKWIDEHFFEVIDTTAKEKDVWVVINPIVNLQGGGQRGGSERLYQNTRGLEAHGRIKNLEFYTGFFENQARFAAFQQDYFHAQGELRLNSAGEYVVSNAIVPMGGRTKPFQETALDYASSVSYVRYTHLLGGKYGKALRLEFGNTPNFVGWGHRSVLLSDNSFNATAFKFEFDINDKWSFSKINAKHLNLMRRQFTTAVEPPFEKKNYSAHYLVYRPSKNTTIGLFEATVYFREDSVQSRWMHPLYFNPIPLVNTAVFGWENAAAKSLVGVNFAQRIRDNHLVFAQLASDQLGEDFQYALQFGWTWMNVLALKNLTIHAEFNKASDRMYSANNRRMAYTHFNLPLAHTLGNGFDELIGRVFYHYNKWYIQLHAVLYQADQPMENQTHLFQERTNAKFNDHQRVSYNEMEVGYLFNARSQLSVFARGIYRYSAGETQGIQTTTLFFVGIRNRLFNQYTDF